MKFPIRAALFVSFLASPSGMAQTIGDRAVSSQASQNSPSDRDQAPRTETTGGEERNPEPHIYRLGEHLSEVYGRYDLVDDWARHQLKKPPDGSHWVQYGENYLLVKATDGLITQIVAAS
jgi:Ni/Co efflux regulator RcnB